MVRQFPRFGMANSIAREMIVRRLRFGKRKPAAYTGKGDAPGTGGTAGGGKTSYSGPYWAR